MAYRQIQVKLAGDRGEELRELFSLLEVFDVWLAQGVDEGMERVVFAVTLHAEQVEGVVDRLRERYGDEAGYRVVVLEVTAVDPRPEDEETEVEDPRERYEEEADKGQGLRLTKARISRDELLTQVESGFGVTRVYLVMTVLSMVVATAGVIRDNVALVIGSMVIAPLLVPSMALALATTLWDVKRLWRAGLTAVIGLAVGLGVAVLAGLVVPFDPGMDEIAIRRAARYSDIAVALAAGMAGAVSVTTGVSASLVGVAVAVALVPPLAVCGLLIGTGDWEGAGGAGLLVAINLAAINLAAVATFRLQGLRAEDGWTEVSARRAVIFSLIGWLAVLAGLAGLIWLAGMG